jgi:hypothetical protein
MRPVSELEVVAADDGRSVYTSSERKRSRKAVWALQGRDTLAACLGSELHCDCGSCFVGKTSLPARLRLGLPVFDLDDYHWRQTPLATDEEWVAKHSEMIRGDRWVISGEGRGQGDSCLSGIGPRPELMFACTKLVEPEHCWTHLTSVLRLR